ncbi:MAG: dihydroorotase, partial [Pedobacter sp.]
MSLLIKGITIADASSEFNGKTCDVRVDKGNIIAIESKLEAQKSETVFDGVGAVLSPGFFDLNCVFGDPGLETKEDIQTGTAAAAAGGFTEIAIMPNTKPVVHSKGEVEYIL